MATALSENVLLAAALDYAKKDWPVFPCHPETKRPLTENGFKDASTDPKIIAAWWRGWPNAMIGVPTGSAIGAWVLDIDDPGAFETTCDIALPATRRANTGKGYHLYFQWDPAQPVSNAQRTTKGWPFPTMPGAETRGEGGYAIVPPSLHPGGKHYIWCSEEEPSEAPDELVRLVRERGKQNAAPVSVEPSGNTPMRGDNDTDTAYGLAALKRECDLIALAPAGAQEGTLNNAALKIGGLVGGKELSIRTAASELIAAGLAMPSLDPAHPWTAASVSTKVSRGLQDGMRAPRSAPLAVTSPKQRAQAHSKEKDPSEDDIALAFTAKHGGTLRYDNDVGAWFEWDGTRWAQDNSHRAFTYARNLAREFGGAGKAAFAGGVERFARADFAHSVTADLWDADPMLLGTPGGTVDLRTGDYFDARPSDYITKLAGCSPAHGEPIIWLRFLDEALGGDQEAIRFLKLWVGYCLTGDTREHALIFIHGLAGTGKSVFLNTVAAILGDYAVTAAMETFTASKFDRHSTELAMLRGARLVTASETEEGRAWAEARIKTLTGGDKVTARFMRQDNFTFRPHFKLTIVGNHAPRLTNPDDAMRRRFNILGFNVKPAAPDLLLERRLAAEHPQILAWAIAGCREWQTSGLFRPAAVQNATTEYFAGEDLMGQWIEERCSLRPGAFEIPTKLYNDWRKYAEEHGEAPGTAIGFGKKMAKRGLGATASNGVRANRGIELNDVGAGYDAA